jgi:UDP-glucose 4-epimerase
MDVLAFRFFNVFGPWQRPDHVYAAVVPKWMWRAIHGLPLPLDGDGRQSRDFTSVHTVTDVLVDAVERRVSHPTPTNLAYGNNISLLELKSAMEEIVGRELEIQPEPPRTADVQASQNDPTLLKELFPDIQPRSFESTLRETYEWLLSQRGHIPPPQ